MPDAREEAARRFAASAGWGGARWLPLAGDASARRYFRLRGSDGATAVLMDAPPGCPDDAGTFVRVAAHLRRLGLSAPLVLADQAAEGLLLLEDLGDALYPVAIAAGPGQEALLYEAATEVLLRLRSAAPLTDLPRYGTAEMAEAVAPAASFYANGLFRGRADPAVLCAAMAAALSALPPAPPVMILRDYHAGNLLWLEGRSGVARVGLLDFQTAMLGHPAFDLVSLLQDARRDVCDGLEADLTAFFARETGVAPADFAAGYHVVGAQRHLRILGIFARLALTQGKDGYLQHLPRVWRDLSRDLEDPACAPLAGVVKALLPPPEDHEAMRDRCRQIA